MSSGSMMDIAGYLRARRSMLAFEKAILAICRSVLDARRTRIERALGCELEFEESLARREDVGAAQGTPAATWIALKSPAERWGGFYAGFYWLDEGGDTSVRTLAAVYFNSDTIFERAREFFAAAIEARELDLYRTYGDYEIYFHRPLDRADPERCGELLGATLDRWVEIVEDANRRSGRTLTA